MREIKLEQLAGDVEDIVPSSSSDRVVLTRNGKPVAIVTGVSNLDEEDLGYIESPEFWKLIAERRKQSRISLNEAFTRLEKREAAEAAAKKG